MRIICLIFKQVGGEWGRDKENARYLKKGGKNVNKRDRNLKYKIKQKEN